MKKYSLPNLFSDMTLTKKMAVSVFLVVLALLLVFFFVFQVMVSDLRDYMIDQNEYLLSLVHAEMEKQVQSMQQAATRIMGTEYVKRYISYPTKDNEAMLRSMITRHGLVNIGSGHFWDSISLSIYDLFSLSHVSGFLVVPDSDTPQYVYHGNVPDSQTCYELIDYVNDHLDDGGNLSALCLSQELYDAIDGLVLVMPAAGEVNVKYTEVAAGGYLILFAGRYHLQQIAARYYREDLSLALYDQEGKALWVTAPQYADATSPHPVDTQIVDYNGVDTLVVSDRLSSTPYTIALYAPIDTVTSQLQVYWYLFFAAILLILAMYFILISFFSRSVTSRLNEMLHVMEEVRSGDTSSRYEVIYHDEISQIGSEFNTMIDNLQKYHIDMATAALRQKEAELHALQSQINPHFLYNALDCIRASALSNQDEITVRQIQVLANMFRYTISGNVEQEKVTIQQELDHICDYLSMMRFRFEERFSMELDISDEILQLQTLKLILQPVVENAFTHGINHMANGGAVRISGWLDREQQRVVFRVKDNGKGIDDQRMAQLQALLKEHPLAKRKGVPFMGLVNINDRIRIAYGNEYGVQIQSQPGQGTDVTLQLPVSVPHSNVERM